MVSFGFNAYSFCLYFKLVLLYNSAVVSQESVCDDLVKFFSLLYLIEIGFYS